jgi:hypothetical protein
MKKYLVAAIMVSIFLVSGSLALIGVGVGGVANLASDPAATGLALELNLPIPIIPLFSTKLEANYFQVESSSLPFTMIPVMLTQTLNLPMMPVYAGFGIGTTILSSSDSTFTAPAMVINYSAYVGYKKSIMALTDFFIQGGYVVSKFDLAPGVTYDGSGIEVKAGIRFGI